jgi:hypothetical protein
MPGIGPDIKEVLEELGTEALVRRTPTPFKEKLTYDVNGQASNPFMREFSLAASLSYDTKIVSGDVIQVNGGDYLVIHKTADMFEGNVVEYEAIIYKCNLKSGSLLLSLNEVKHPTTFAVTIDWAVKNNAVYGLMYKDSRGALLNEETTLGKEPTFSLMCIVPEHYNVVRNDRLHISATEYYRVQDIENYAYPGVSVLTLVEDDRGVYSP